MKLMNMWWNKQGNITNLPTFQGSSLVPDFSVPYVYGGHEPLFVKY